MMNFGNLSTQAPKMIEAKNTNQNAAPVSSQVLNSIPWQSIPRAIEEHAGLSIA
jgi:hypothetical protein